LRLSHDQSQGFSDLGGQVQSLILAVARGQNDVRDIRQFISAQEVSAKQHVTNEFEMQRTRLVAETFRTRILDDLFFPALRARQEELKEAHKQTFQWIFDRTGAALRPWSNFAEWLEGGQAIYWINGKAGSGKSTLMNTIYQDKRTVTALKVWSGSRQLLTPTFFFWSTGSELQKTSVGLLRSLIYQIITTAPSLITRLSKSIESIWPNVSQQLPVWTERGLRTLLFRLLMVDLIASRICIFVDGLDEFTGDHDALLSLIQRLGRSHNIKLCVSSRPDPKYEASLKSSATLRLQDLTKGDIGNYASARLADAAPHSSHAWHTFNWLGSTASEITERAEGVFLWVELAVNEQIQGLDNDDTTQQLQQRLERFPNQLERVYTLMFQAIDPVYRREVALYLNMAIYIEGLLLRHMALAAYDGLDEFLELFPDQPAFDFHGHCHSTSRRVLTFCKGFLEVQKNPYDLLESYVTFVHRTAAEFLQKYEGAQTILNLEASVEVDIRLLHVKARIANLILNDFPQPDECHDADLISFARGIIRDLARCEQATEKTFAALTELLDRVLVSPTRWYNPSPVHWSVLSGLIEAEDFDMGDSVSRYPVDLLGNAARSGLRLYVLQSLDSDPALQKSRTHGLLVALRNSSGAA